MWPSQNIWTLHENYKHNSMNNHLSNCGLIDGRIRASEKDLPVWKWLTNDLLNSTEFYYRFIRTSGLSTSYPVLCILGTYHALVEQHANRLENWISAINTKLNNKSEKLAKLKIIISSGNQIHLMPKEGSKYKKNSNNWIAKIIQALIQVCKKWWLVYILKYL